VDIFLHLLSLLESLIVNPWLLSESLPVDLLPPLLLESPTNNFWLLFSESPTYDLPLPLLLESAPLNLPLASLAFCFYLLQKDHNLPLLLPSESLPIHLFLSEKANDLPLLPPSECLCLVPLEKTNDLPLLPPSESMPSDLCLRLAHLFLLQKNLQYSAMVLLVRRP
jgi:hypothetical protein